VVFPKLLLEVGKRQTEMASSKRASRKKLLTAQDVNGYLPTTRKDRTLVTAKGALCLIRNAKSLKQFLSALKGAKRK
jgi:hypothetical protein